MSERPILFSAPMVRAILAGTKTQTRRIVKVPKRFEGFSHPSAAGVDFSCPYGWRSDRLWVRETFSYDRAMHERGDRCVPWYWADGNPTYGDWTRPKPSIHMPRWASRITLWITDVRVERLNDISQHDAMAEGVSVDSPATFQAVAAYRDLWESINGPGSWAENPYVWVIEFMSSSDLGAGNGRP